MDFKQLAQGALFLTKLPANLMWGSSDIPIRTESSWEEEKDDILERANWLCEKIIVKPEQLIKEMPSLLGEEYAGQWAIYCCSMLAHALANISVIYPEKKEQCPELIARLIEIVNTPTIRKYDTLEWKEDAMDSIHGKKSHMTYLSILAWMITNYKLIGGDNRFEPLLYTLCEALNRRMLESKYDLNLLSFPYKPIFLPDMLVAIIALRNYARLYNGTYQDTVDKWLDNAKNKWIHKGTGLLLSMLPEASRYKSSRPLRGSYVALNCAYLALVDEAFAFEQHERMKTIMSKEATVMGKTFFGIKEYMKKSPKFTFVGGDAGLVIEGISAGGTAFALGSSTYFGDWEFRSKLLRTAEMAGGTTKSKGKRCYRLGEIFITGEATALAMRTNIKKIINNKSYTMTLKDYINKELLTAEEEKLLIDELYKDPEEFLSDCSLNDISKNIKEIIEEHGLKNGDIAYAIMEDYDGIIDLDNYENGKWTEETRSRREKHNYWLLKATELGCEAIDIEDVWFEDENGEKEFDSFCLDYYSPLVKKAEADCLNSWGCRYALGLDGEDVNYKYARQLFEKAKNDDSKISLYYIYANGLGVKKNLKKANSFIKNLPTNTSLYAFKSNISEGIKIEEDNEQEQPKKEKKPRKPRKKNKVKSFFKKIISLFK